MFQNHLYCGYCDSYRLLDLCNADPELKKTQYGQNVLSFTQYSHSIIIHVVILLIVTHQSDNNNVQVTNFKETSNSKSSKNKQMLQHILSSRR